MSYYEPCKICKRKKPFQQVYTIGIYFLTNCPTVTRIEAKSEKFDMFMHLDINTEIYNFKEGEKFSMALAPTLNLDGTPDTGYYLQVTCSSNCLYSESVERWT